MTEGHRVAGIVLAGGRGSRMGGGGKCLRRLGKQTLLEHAWSRASAQVGVLLLSFNDDPRQLPLDVATVLADTLPGQPGPLAGILSGLEYLREHRPDLCWLASFACDTPWFPRDLVQRLLAAAEHDDARVAVATASGRMQPVFALWSTAVATRLREAIVEREQRGVGRFLRELPHVCVDWPVGEADPFFNINTPADLRQAELRLQQEARAQCPKT
jgi:molybdopterin-guanine dinucleotide biosynthesis protein A